MGKKLDTIAKEINEKYGNNALIKLDSANIDVDRIPTGIMSVDYRLGGGLPKGKMATVVGPEGGGKTAIALNFAGQAQKHGRVVYIDLENAVDLRKAENSGVDLDTIFFSQPDSAEATLEVMEMCLGADDVAAIIIDSVAAMATEAEINGDYGDAHVASLARLLSLGLKKINQHIAENKLDTIILFTNQQRDIIGGYGPVTKTMPGGRALKYYSSTLMEVTRVGNIEQSIDKVKEVVGQTTQVFFKKNKFAAPFKKASFDILWDSGISNESTIIDLAVRSGYIDKGKSGHYTDTRTAEKLAHGKPAMLEYLRENEEYTNDLKELILELL